MAKQQELINDATDNGEDMIRATAPSVEELIAAQKQIRALHDKKPSGAKL